MDNPYPNGNGNGDGYAGRITGLEFRYGELKQDVVDLKQQIATGIAQIGSDIRQARERSDMRMEQLGSDIAAKGQTKPGIVIACAFGLFGMITTLVSAGWYLTTLQTQNLATPLTLKAEVLGTALAAVDRRLSGIESDGRDIDKALQLNDARDSRSEQDRADTRVRLDRMQEQLGKLSGDVIANTSGLAEIETQFKADELVATQRESNTEQWKGMFYNWQTGLVLPPRGPVVPGIAREPSRPGGSP